MKKFALVAMLALYTCHIYGSEPKPVSSFDKDALSHVFTPRGNTNPLATNKHVIIDFYAAMRTADFKTMDSLLAPNYKVQDSTVPFNPPHSTFDAFSKNMDIRLKALHKALPQFDLTINELIAEGNKVFSSVQISGIQRGEFLGAKATDKPLKIRLFVIFTLDEGKIVRINEIWNQLSVMKQMGYIVL